MRKERFHVHLTKGQRRELLALKDGGIVTFRVHAGIYGYITPEESCPNLTIDGRGFLLNLYCPDGDDFAVHFDKPEPRVAIK